MLLKSMVEQYIVGVAVVIASLLGFVFLYYNSLVRFWGLSKLKRRASMEFPKENRINKNGSGEDVGTTDIIIVGAGVAGAALAYSLGKDGRQVRVIERDLNPPDRIAGESLMPGGYLKLITNNLNNKCDMIVSLEQGTVTSLLEENGTIKGVHYKDKSSQMLTAYASLTVVCDGCFSNLRRSLCNSRVDVPSYFVGFILTNCKLSDQNHGAIILADPSPIVFYPISSTEIRCMVDVPSQNLPSLSNGEMSHYLKTLVAPKVFPETYDSFISAIEKKDNIKIMPNRIMADAPHRTPGALLIGDSLNMRHAITGGGMTVALSDVVLLRDLLRPSHDLSDASVVCKYLQSFYTLRKPMSSTINILASVLHKVFSSSSDPTIEDIQHACIGYLRLGGVFSSGLSAMISGLCPRPLSLAFHLFALAIYGVGRLLLPFPSPKRLWNGAKLFWVSISTKHFLYNTNTGLV
ncbi:hypothetical protein Gogos_002454 [Gossypium gossypioides]|uniref:Squalene monooxygenase n=1 Tax=Gossypium gossypioides TaxID=34282 RepID=A0A7J9CRG3_GOSGO|nr:hypothetical protein [Gossypium gossypioides]